MLNTRQKVFYVAGIVLLLAAGVAVATVLMATKKDPPHVTREVVGPLVEVVVAERRTVEVDVQGHGSVRPTVKADVVPQVGGKVLKVHANLVTGGFIPAGETIVKIDAADYDLAQRQAMTAAAAAEAQKATAEAQIAEASARVDDAQYDLDRLNDLVQRGVTNPREQRKALTALEVAKAQKQLAESARAAAQSQLAAAQVQADQAKLNVERTEVTLPFDAVVTAESVDVGQFIVAGQPIASVYGTATFEIPVPLEDEQLRWFTRVPLAHEVSSLQVPRDALPIADVYARFAGRDCHWIGRVVRTEATVDQRTRTMQVVVEVEDPLPVTRGERDASKPPLIPGTFVDVTVRGREVEGVIELPRHALHPGDVVWIVDGDRLQMRTVHVLRRSVNNVLIDKGIEAGDLVIVTPLDTVTDGMKVRVPSRSGDAEAAPDPTDETSESEPSSP